MAVLLVPTSPGVPFHSSKVRLEGRDFVFQFAWNEREARWYLSISDESAVPLVMGLKLVANWPLLRFYQPSNAGLPPGELAAIDLTADGTPPGLEDLGIGLRVELTYRESTT